MDIISFNEASTANGRIENFIENPDSTSGIVTVPKTIASGETITIPAGRVAVLPNLVVDGTLNIDGEVFIPSGATFDDLDTQIALKAPLVSPALTGTPTAPTQTALDNSTKIATTAYVDGKMVRGTAVNSTSGTSIDFTGIPSWVKRITVMFSGVSTNGASVLHIQIGSGTIQTTGYECIASGFTATSANTLGFTSGFATGDTSSTAQIRNGHFEIINIASNRWLFDGGLSLTGLGKHISSGGVTLSGTLDRVRITTVNGTDAFDAGQINIMYEG